MSGIRRRAFLGAGAAAGAGALAGRLADPPARAAAPPPPPAAPLTLRVAFDGRRQAGVATAKPRQAIVVAFDAVADDRAAVTEAIRALSVHGRRLTQGHRTLIGNPGDGPTPESGILGVDAPPDALTVTIGLGASLFDERYGLARRRPAGLKAMPAFPDDDLDAAQCHGDVLVQLCAGTQETLLNAVRDLMRATRGTLAARWKVEGFTPAARERGAGRNLLGFKDGTSQARADDVFARDGGTFAVVRVIRNRVEFWDRVALSEQELMIGRRKDTGQLLADVPTDAHVRLARPRTEPRRMLRRGFNYSRGIDAAGQLDMGLLFVSFQRELTHFEAAQHRLAGEPLVDYVVPTGGGYFYLPPGAQGPDDWVGSGLLS